MGPGLAKRIFIVFAAVMLGAAAVQAAPADRQQASVDALGPRDIDRVVVLKSERRLVLMRGESVVRVFSVALGRYPTGPKRRAGDARTPEGAYELDYKLEDSAFYRAIHISYPNAQDRARARAEGVDPGGKIMIHGLPNDRTAGYVGHPRIDWTQGCIAVTNAEMDELWRLVEIGTPIEIHP
jgi:murein L,D-transpeptidase YafK